MRSYLVFLVLCTAGLWSKGLCQLTFSENPVDLITGDCANVTLKNSNAKLKSGVIKLSSEFSDVATVTPSKIKIEEDVNSWVIRVCGQVAGSTLVSADVTSDNYTSISYLHVTVAKVELLFWVSQAVGWIYFLAWSVSFYPQLYTNYVRKSVIGLNFDFLALNIVGFVLYSAYNVGFYYFPSIQGEYFERYPQSLSPVHFNDVFFSVHAVLITCVTIYQCLIYERGDQRVSAMASGILTLYFLIIIVCTILVYINKMAKLDFLYYCSYIKLSITLIKYIPQAIMNYTRKSTEGWSIGNVLLDFTGGVFSLLQMVVDSYNFNDWESFIGSPIKFGLGIFSIGFDVLFIVQHYILYRY